MLTPPDAGRGSTACTAGRGTAAIWPGAFWDAVVWAAAPRKPLPQRLALPLQGAALGHEAVVRAAAQLRARLVADRGVRLGGPLALGRPPQ